MSKRIFYISMIAIWTTVIVWCMISLCFNGLPCFTCPLKFFTGVPCPFCGLTRSCLLLFHGDVWIALQTNPLISLLLIILLFPFALYDVFTGRNHLYSFFIHLQAMGVIGIFKTITLVSVIGVWILSCFIKRV